MYGDGNGDDPAQHPDRSNNLAPPCHSSPTHSHQSQVAWDSAAFRAWVLLDRSGGLLSPAANDMSMRLGQFGSMLDL